MLCSLRPAPRPLDKLYFRALTLDIGDINISTTSWVGARARTYKDTAAEMKERRCIARGQISFLTKIYQTAIVGIFFFEKYLEADLCV